MPRRLKNLQIKSGYLILGHPVLCNFVSMSQVSNFNTKVHCLLGVISMMSIIVMRLLLQCQDTCFQTLHSDQSSFT